MDLYEYILEDASESHYYYYSWEEKPDKVVASFIKGLRKSGHPLIDIVDVFPEPNSRDVKLGAPLQIQTKCGKTMYLPEDFRVRIHTAYRVLFEYVTDE